MITKGLTAEEEIEVFNAFKASHSYSGMGDIELHEYISNCYAVKVEDYKCDDRTNEEEVLILISNIGPEYVHVLRENINNGERELLEHGNGI